jgi:hypothetical protein
MMTHQFRHYVLTFHQHRVIEAMMSLAHSKSVQVLHYEIGLFLYQI